MSATIQGGRERRGDKKESLGEHEDLCLHQSLDLSHFAPHIPPLLHVLFDRPLTVALGLKRHTMEGVKQLLAAVKDAGLLA